MKELRTIFILPLFIVVGFLSCYNSVEKNNTTKNETSFNYLALGDSYTIGESVLPTQNFPFQLQDTIARHFNKTTNYKIIAKTGWTTTDLLSAIKKQNLSNNYNLVTLLIGVNNQYQGKPFSLYEREFPKLLDIAIQAAQGNPKNVVVVSIPDYAFTPFGQKSSNSKKISEEIDQYNAFAKEIATKKGVAFQDITDITRTDLANQELVAKDGLHPSATAYTLFVDRLFNLVKEGLD